MNRVQFAGEYAKLDDRGRLTLTKKYLQFLGVKPNEYVEIYTLETEHAIAIEKPDQKGST